MQINKCDRIKLYIITYNNIYIYICYIISFNMYKYIIICNKYEKYEKI